MNRKKQEYIVTGIAFTIFFAIISYKLTNASLWFDETVEYWYSKYFVGALPYADGNSNMYQRIVSTYQPPLFNVLMHFWLKIQDTQWWMRMFGVVMGFIGAVGVYKTILFGTNSKIKSSVAIVLYAMIFRLTYYWQEVAEYSLMLALLSWTIYFFLLVVNSPNTKRIILFVIFCILPVYSQYGAAFPVVAFCILALVKIIKSRNGKQIKTLLGSYGLAAIFAALPLYIYFLKPQMIEQGTNSLSLTNTFSLKDFYNNYITVFKWNFISNITDTGEHVLAVATVLMVIVVLFYIIKGKKAWLKYLLVANIICYSIYYFAVFTGVYSYGSFGARYNLFLIPLWFVTSLLLISQFLSEFSEIEKFKYSQEVTSIVEGMLVAGLFCLGYTGWISISEGYTKENIREATNTWISNSGYTTDTIVYYAADSGFSYYVTHSDEYTDDMLDNVIFQEWDLGRDMADYYGEWVDSIYEEWPSSLYIVASHLQDDLNTLVSVFTDAGYTSSDIYNSGGARLIYLELTQ